jgi:hypothetical protein
MPKVVPTPGRNANNLFHPNYHREVDAATLIRHVHASDEALVLTILLVKGLSLSSTGSSSREDDAANDDDLASQLTDDDFGKENQNPSTSSSSSGKRKRGPRNGKSFLFSNGAWLC